MTLFSILVFRKYLNYSWGELDTYLARDPQRSADEGAKNQRGVHYFFSPQFDENAGGEAHDMKSN